MVSKLLRLQSLVLCFALTGAVTPSGAVAQDAGRTVGVRDLATLRDIDGLNVSPDGKWAAFSIAQADPDRNRYDIVWQVVDIATGRACRAAKGGDLLPEYGLGMLMQYVAPGTSAWSADSRWLAYLRRENGRTQIWRTRCDGHSAEQLTHNEADARGLVHSRDGRRILFQTAPSQAQVAKDLEAEARTGFLYDERFIPMYSPHPIAARDQGSNIFAQPKSQVAAHRVWAYELATRRERPATQAEQTEYAELTGPAHAGPRVDISAKSQGGAVAWLEARDPERQGLYPPRTIVAQTSDSAEPMVCGAPECTSVRMHHVLWRNNSELLFIGRDGWGAPDINVYAWRPKDSSAPRLILSRPGVLSDCAVAQDKLLCLFEQPDHPNRLVAIDPDTGAVDTRYEPNPNFAGFNLGSPPQHLIIRARSGAETTGYLVLPPQRRAGERLPLAIVTYACSGFLRGASGDEYPIYPFAAQGMAVVCVNAPQDWDRKAWMDPLAYSKWSRGPGEPMRRRVEEILDAAIVQLDGSGVIDPDRVGITGLSYGTEMVSYALLHMPRLAAAIADMGDRGPSQYPYQGHISRAFSRLRGIGRPDETPERWREISFSPHAEKVRAPLLLNTADHELVASLDAVTALQDAGRAVEMYVFPDEYHVKWQPAHRLAVYNRNIDWMNFWLRGVEDPAPTKAEQYKRWRAMRVKQCELFKDAAAPWYCRQ